MQQSSHLSECTVHIEKWQLQAHLVSYNDLPKDFSSTKKKNQHVAWWEGRGVAKLNNSFLFQEILMGQHHYHIKYTDHYFRWHIYLLTEFLYFRQCMVFAKDAINGTTIWYLKLNAKSKPFSKQCKTFPALLFVFLFVLQWMTYIDLYATAVYCWCG